MKTAGVSKIIVLSLGALLATAGGCASQPSQENKQPQVSHYEKEMIRVGNTHCRQLAARLAANEPDREFGGYDPTEFPANWTKLYAWVAECRPLLREIWEWKYLNIYQKLNNVKDERLLHQLMEQSFESHKEELVRLLILENRLLVESGLLEKYR